MKAADDFLPARYRAARQALADAHHIDEAKAIRDKAKAMQVYAYEAKDRSLIGMATEIRLRAEIKAGELLSQMKVEGERDGGRGGDRKSRFRAGTVKLEALGVTKKQSSDWQKLAALSADEREAKIDRAKDKAVVKITPTRTKSERDAVAQCVAKVHAAITAALRIADTAALFTAVRAEFAALATARGYEFGTTSASEAARKDAYIQQLERQVRQLELARAGRDPLLTEPVSEMETPTAREVSHPRQKAPGDSQGPR